MGRRKLVTDEKLIELIGKYYVEKGNSNPKTLKISLIGKYIRDTYDENVTDTVIRRSGEAVQYIDKLKSDAARDERTIIAVYRPIDVEKIIDEGGSTTSLRNKLSAINAYNKDLVTSVSRILEQETTRDKKIADLEVKLKNLTQENALLIQEKDALKAGIKQRDARIKELENYINNTVYPEIANELLKKDKFLSNTANVINEKTSSKPIDANTKIARFKTDVINTLLQNIEEDK